ncbi:MAG: hypothetical protein ACHP7J_02660 [Terriglobales bacterium]
MRFEPHNFDASEDAIDNSNGNRYCENCKWLLEAVRDLEQQRCDAIEQRSRRLGFLSKFSDEFVRREELFLSKMRAIEQRRKAALDVLAKHRQLDHQPTYSLDPSRAIG